MLLARPGACFGGFRKGPEASFVHPVAGRHHGAPWGRKRTPLIDTLTSSGLCTLSISWRAPWRATLYIYTRVVHITGGTSIQASTTTAFTAPGRPTVLGPQPAGSHRTGHRATRAPANAPTNWAGARARRGGRSASGASVMMREPTRASGVRAPSKLHMHSRRVCGGGEGEREV